MHSPCIPRCTLSDFPRGECLPRRRQVGPGSRGLGESFFFVFVTYLVASALRSSYPNVKHRFPVTSVTVASCVACLQTRSYTHLPQITSKLPGCRGCCCRFPCNIQEINHSRESKRVIKLIAWPTLSILIVCAGSPRCKATERSRVLNAC